MALATVARRLGSVAMPRSSPSGLPNRWQSVNWTSRVGVLMGCQNQVGSGGCTLAAPERLHALEYNLVIKVQCSGVDFRLPELR